MIKTNAILLKEALGKIISIAEKKPTRASLVNCLIIYKGNNVIINATDLEVSAKITLAAESNEDGQFCINIKNLFDLVKELPDEIVVLEKDVINNYVHIKCKNAQFSLITADPNDFPPLNFEKPELFIQANGKEISKIIDKVSYAMSYDETRVFLNGIYIHKTQNGLRAVATDGHRLAMVDFVNEIFKNGPQIEHGILIPKKGVYELKKLADYNSEKLISLYADMNYLCVCSEKDELLIRLISREFPKYQSIIPNKTTFKAEMSKEELFQSIRRIRILCNEQTNGIKINFSNNHLQISSRNNVLGHGSEKVEAIYDGSEIEIGLNAKYLMDTLSAIKDERIVLEFNNSMSPMIIKSVSDNNFLNIIMPLRP